MTKQKTAQAAKLRSELRHFTGDLTRFRQGLNRRLIYTPGVQYLAEQAEAYWLIDAIGSHLGSSHFHRAVQRDGRIEQLHFWQLVVAEDQSAVLTARADSGVTPFVRQEIPWTTFPLESIDIWVGNNGTTGHFICHRSIELDLRPRPLTMGGLGFQELTSQQYNSRRIHMNTTNTNTPATVKVCPQRLQFGYRCHQHNKTLDQGDINASYSADLIGMENRIRKPFYMQGGAWITISLGHRPAPHATAYQIVPTKMFTGTPHNVSKKTTSGQWRRRPQRSARVLSRHDGQPWHTRVCLDRATHPDRRGGA